MLKNLFGSNTRSKLLQIFLSNPESEYHIRGLTRKLNLKLNSVRRELLNLESLGILKGKKSQKKYFFTVNKSSIIYPELREIILKLGEGEKDWVSRLRKLGRVKLALLSGIFLKVKEAPVDIILVGEVDKKKLEKFLEDIKNELSLSSKKGINYTLMTEKEFSYRQMCRDRFLIEIFSKPYQVLIDNIGFQKEEGPKNKE